MPCRNQLRGTCLLAAMAVSGVTAAQTTQPAPTAPGAGASAAAAPVHLPWTTEARAAEATADASDAHGVAHAAPAPSAAALSPAPPVAPVAGMPALPSSHAAPRGWSEAVAHFAELACGKDLRGLVASLNNGPVLRTFASDELQLPERLLGATTGSKVIGMHVYPRVPATLATDLADTFRAAAAADLPAAVRERMIPVDAAAAARANQTAAQWLVQMLQPGKEQPVAVVVLWRQETTDTYTASVSRPVFLLMKGTETVTGKHVFRQIIFGDPLDAPR
ncbi:MAG TPA: hypothetical protein VER17_19125 [Tepidisphaeraceae bacterium]|nr:hypothetical protein [Tepidisphaeraceae bacterium]